MIAFGDGAPVRIRLSWEKTTTADLAARTSSSRRMTASAEPCEKTTIFSNQWPRPSVPSHSLGIRFEILVVKNRVQETYTDRGKKRLAAIPCKRVPLSHSVKGMLCLQTVSTDVNGFICTTHLAVSHAGPQGSSPRIGVSSALAARTGSKYSRRKAILPPTARRNSTYSC